MSRSVYHMLAIVEVIHSNWIKSKRQIPLIENLPSYTFYKFSMTIEY